MAVKTGVSARAGAPPAQRAFCWQGQAGNRVAFDKMRDSITWLCAVWRVFAEARQTVQPATGPLPVPSFVLRRSVILYLAWLSCSAQAAEPLPPLKVDPSLLPPSSRAAKAAPKRATTPEVETADKAAPAEAPLRAAETFPVAAPEARPPAPTPGADAAPAPAASGQSTALREAEPVRPATEATRPAAAVAAPVQPRPAASGSARASIPAPSPYDEAPTPGNVTIARGLPPLKVDRSLLGPPPVARRRVPAPKTEVVDLGTRPDGDASAGATTSAPPLVAQDDTERMMRGSMTLSEYVQRNPASRATLMAAEQLSGTTDEVMRAEGAAELRRPGTTLTADTIVYEPPTDELQADGNVKLVRNEDVIEGPSLRYKLDRSEGVFDKPRYTVRRNLQTGEDLRTTTGSGHADSMEFLGENHIRMQNATYSTCGPDNPDWYAKAESLELDFVSEEGEGRNGTVYFKGVPVLYSPWLDFSLNNRRKSGFLTPTFGTSNRTGIDLIVPYYWNIAPNMDATIAPRVLGTRGFMLSNEFRYVDSGYSGVARLDYLFNDSILNRSRHALSLQHLQQFSPRIVGSLNINAVSDRDYYTDLGSRLSITSISYLARQGSLSYSGDWWTASASALEYQVLANLSPVYSQMPALALNAYRADLPAGMAFRLDSSFTDFRIDNPAQDEGRRTVVYPQLSLPVQTSYLSITPKVGVHFSNYELDRGTANAALPTSLSRSIPIFSLDASTVFESDSDLLGQGLIQTLEPRLYYVLSPHKDQSDYPVFDTALADFNFAQIFSENVFVGQDRIADSNQLTAALVSRFIDPDTGDERARAAFGQRFYFSDQLVTLPGGTPRTERIASTLAALSGELLPDTRVDAAIQYNTDLSQTERYNLSARWNPRPAHVLNAAYRFRRGTTTTTEVRDVDLSAQWPLTTRWYGVARYNYSVAERRLVEGLGGLEYNGGCWIGRVVFQRIATNVEQSRTALFFQLELNDFSRIGSNPLDALKRSIPGYGQINQSTADPIFGEDF
jgi:LPS-assembly protein